MSPKEITPLQVQEWTEEIVIMLSRLAVDRVHADIACIRETIAKRNLTPEAIYFLRLGLKSDVLNSLVRWNNVAKGSYSETGNESYSGGQLSYTYQTPFKEWDEFMDGVKVAEHLLKDD